MIQLATLTALLFATSSMALDVRLYSSDPNRDCTGTTTAICSNIAYDACCERGSTPIYRTALCTGLDTVGGGSIPDYCVGFSTPPGSAYTPCRCSCNAEAASENNSGNVCLNCDTVSGLSLRGAGVFYISSSKRDLAEIGNVQCNNHVEPDVMQLDGHSFAISDKHGVPADVTERFWEIFNKQPDIKFEDIPEDLKTYRNMTLVAPLSKEQLKSASRRTLVMRDIEEVGALVKRQGLPSQCPSS